LLSDVVVIDVRDFNPNSECLLLHWVHIGTPSVGSRRLERRSPGSCIGTSKWGWVPRRDVYQTDMYIDR
jgi:hypothetical protein